MKLSSSFLSIYSPFSRSAGPQPPLTGRSRLLGMMVAIVFTAFTTIGVVTCVKKIHAYIITKKTIPDRKPSASELHAKEVAESAKKADKIAIDRYFALLKQYPSLKREGILNDHKHGAYEIFYEVPQIESVRHQVHERILKKHKSAEWAHQASRVGVVAEDDYWLWIRDAVKAPKGLEHTYNRIVMKSQLTGSIGAAILPIFKGKNGHEIPLVLSYRHALHSWELELPRGSAKPGETGAEAAKRELAEETGLVSIKPILLGSMNCDSGALASVVPIYAGTIDSVGSTKHDKTEAIAGTYRYTLNEIENGLEKGYIDVKLKNGSTLRANLHDPFLMSAILKAKSKGLIDLHHIKDIAVD
ncbi:MAG: NUDIX hydrolase [Parachlamydiaceae bacterium]|nr:NUDIX hydrolase [Parachlamydiaceae bacterium]